VKKIGLFVGIALVCSFAHPANAQRGKIIKTASTTIMDPNQDGFVSKTNAGFSNDGYNVDEFEITMFGIPKLGGDVPGDNIGNSCGITDLIPDIHGYSVYAVRDGSNNLIFRFRVGDDNPSVEAWTILLDTDGLFGADDPNATAENPGFEIDITLIKRSNAGVLVYNIDGIDNCPNELITYPYSSHFQISIADEVSCGDPDYFYDFYVPFADIANIFGININTGLRYVAVTNVSATCAMAGQIADVSGVDNDDPEYVNCIPCAFDDLVNNQCPTPIVDLCETCSGFSGELINRPTIDEPVRTGQIIITGTSDPNIFIVLQVFERIGGTDASPIWSATPREEKGDYAVNTAWSITLDDSLKAFDKIVARAQKDENSVPCGGAGGNTATTSVTVVQPNVSPLAIDQLIEVTEDIAKSIVLTGTDSDGDILSFVIESNPVNGTLSGTAPNIIYTPNLNYVGPDSFDFTVSDGVYEDNGTITINVLPVNDPPIITGSNTPVTYAFIPVLIDNAILISDVDDTQMNGATISISTNFQSTEDVLLFTNQNGITGTYNSTTGILTLTGNSSIANYITALRSIQYQNIDATPVLLTRQISFIVNDGDDNSNTHIRDINFNGTNNPPVIVDDDGNPVDTIRYSVNEDELLSKCVLAEDPDGDLPVLGEYNTVTNHGNIVFAGGLCFNFTPTLNFFGEELGELLVCDQRIPAKCDTVIMVITILPVNDPPVVQSLTLDVPENRMTAICVSVTDIENDSHQFTTGVSTTGNGSVANGNSGDLCFNYTPDTGFNGQDIVTVTVCDTDEPAVCSDGTVTINVVPANDPPVIKVNGLPNDTLLISSPEDSVLYFCFEAEDPDGDDLLFQSANNTLGAGSLVPDAIEFCFFFTPIPNDTTRSIWKIQICDNGLPTALCGELTVIIDLIPVNDPPIAIRDTLVSDNDKTNRIDVLLNDFDPFENDDLVLSTTPVLEPTKGTATLNANGTISYRPQDGFVGTDSLQYEVCDTGIPSLCGTTTVVFIVDYPVFKIYNAVSPNNDNLNDYWRINGIEDYPQNQVRIFDRFNNLVFETKGYNNESNNWTGQSNHGLAKNFLPEGTYFYIVLLGDGSSPISGFVVLKLK
jgi:gliding motility-associated-like protein